jgi:arylsulfatase A-like enzyme
VLVILAGLIHYAESLISTRLLIPILPVEVVPPLPASQRLPISAGELSGRNFLLVTIDTTRPDRLGFYGNHEIATPNLDRLASRSSVFTRALATTSITLPSHASILTGRYPHRHGVRRNGLPQLANDQRTLAELLSEHGYDTAAFVSAFILDRRFGLAQGFQRYDDHTHDPASVTGYSERRANITTDRALAWLRRSRDRPFFLWIHYYDPHAEYAPPEPFENSSANPYDAEIAFVDQQIGRLLTQVEATSPEAALVIVTADHGESLGEHGEQTHGLLVNDATLRIPLLIGTTEGLPAAAQIDGLVSQVDLMPTALSLLGLPVPEDLDGIDLTRAPEKDRIVLAESHYGQVSYGWARLAAIYQHRLKYVDGPNPEFYDFSKDPNERKNLFPERLEQAAALREKLIELRGPAADDLVTSAIELDRLSIERLESLGYVASGNMTSQRGLEAQDPAEMLPLLNHMLILPSGLTHAKNTPAWMQPLLTLFSEALPRNESELLTALEEMAEAEPNFAPIHKELAAMYRKQDRPRAAAASQRRFEELLEFGPETSSEDR